MDEKEYWKNKNWDQPVIPDLLKISNTEIERRYKISTTSQLKMNTDPKFRKIKQNGALKTAEIKRQIPKEDYIDLINLFWSIDGRRSDFFEYYCKKYNVKKSAIEHIVYNTINVLPKSKFTKLQKAYHKKNPNQRSESLKKSHANMTEEQKAIKNLNISIAQDPIDETTALAIYDECNLDRTHKAYRACAKKHKDKNGKSISWGQVRKILNGHHYATKDFDIEADVKHYNTIRYGTYKFISPEGNIFEFDDRAECGKWMLEMQYGKNSNRDPLRELALFEKTTPNEPYTCIRRFWKKWTIINLK